MFETREEVGRFVVEGLNDLVVVLNQMVNDAKTGGRKMRHTEVNGLDFLITFVGDANVEGDKLVLFSFAVNPCAGEIVLNASTGNVAIHLEEFNPDNDEEARHSFIFRKNDYIPTKWIGDYSLVNNPKHAHLYNWHKEA